MANQLLHETSPYLLQHVDNPVDWHPWGAEAMRLAEEQDKPILLSIGYAACHWCHVMAHESFEDEATAAQMNADFINVKVDREERPDVDSIYMQAVQAMIGRGGWPMTVFLTPDGKPFYAGTYFPNEPRHGMPSFRQILTGVSQAWKTDRANVVGSAGEVAEQLRAISGVGFEAQDLDATILQSAVRGLQGRFDSSWGGFGDAPKFPQPMTLELLLREHVRIRDFDALEMVEVTLRQMARGGMYDQLGGGFARYSVDHRWLVPHFEKMLYDNAQLARVYLHAWQITGNQLYRRVAEETLDYALLEMRDPGGGFYSSQDADSEGVEGKFYVWSAAEIRDALGEDADIFMRIYGVSEEGNWEGHNILKLDLDPEALAEELGIDAGQLQGRLAAARSTLYELRSQRVRPGLDDKVLTSWNGLMLAALAEAGQAFDRPDYMEAARSNAEFLHRTMRSESGRLFRTWKAGSKPKYNAYLEDYAFLADGLLTLYQATFEPRWFDWARELAAMMLTHFRDADNQGFFDTSDDHEELIHRPKDLQDNAVPSGNSTAAHVLLELSLLTGNGEYWEAAERSIATMGKLMTQYPSGFAQWLNATSFILAKPREVALIGGQEELDPLLAVLRSGYRPFQVLAAGSEGGEVSVPLLENRSRIDGKGTAYVCRQFVCQAPVTSPDALARQLEPA
ncbi:MAG: thioredoxin domain-containing protein [Deltaproteobacteria bacterium]|nr:thioredoxin domain-containing protein [Deltaproteobacteria bacterium]MBT8482300.1 thioredoxin domain-containing protein [Deltaproteobacteria bacterium]NND28381.1 thioredoxin domain-containing protein [Myxococcales bacterium]NNL25162.1 thioredoxin domain-containing protein [Myxococcales bacterium]RZV54708.1 MAG: thioredoxin domain-containing protein [Deltaproteobacteria bacterium]